MATSVEGAAADPATRVSNRSAGAAPPAAAGGAVYGMGLIGAAVYYIGAADGFWWGVLGVLKAFVWPAFLVYELLVHVGA